MADALPFVQVNLTQGGVTPGTDTGGRGVSGETAEPGLFDSLVAEFASAQEPEAQASVEASVPPVPPAPQMMEPAGQEQASLQPPVLLAESALSLVASMKSEPDKAEQTSQPLPEPAVDTKAVDALLQKMEALMNKGLLSPEGAEKLASLLSKLKTAKPEELPSLREELLQTLEELSPELEPEVAEDLKQQLAVLFPGQPEGEMKTDPASVPAPTEVKEKTEKPVTGAKKLPSREKPEETEETEETEPDEEPAADGTAEPAAAAMPQDTRQPDDGGKPREGAVPVTEPEQKPAQTAETNSPEKGTAQPAREDKTQRRQSPSDEAVAAAAAASQARAQEAAPKEPAASQKEENQAQAPTVQRAGEEQQSNTSRDNGGNTGDAGAQSSRGQQQPAQLGLRRAAGNAPAGEDARNRTDGQDNRRGVNFQSFFEGVLSSRRTGAAPAPMSLAPNTPNAAYAPRAEVLRDGLVNVIRFVRADGVRRANVIVDPPALGRISVELTTSTSGVEASIRVSSEQVRQLVQDQISQLRMTLEQQGVQVTQFDVDVQQDSGERQQGQGQPGQDGEQRRRGRMGDAEEPEEAEDGFRVDLEEGMLHWVA